MFKRRKTRKKPDKEPPEKMHPMQNAEILPNV
jgi:hypothetical protein